MPASHIRRLADYDVVVIGAGLSGFMAAAAARARARSVLVIAQGLGVLPLTTGCVDVLADPADPWAALSRLVERLPAHPYSLAGLAAVRRGIDYFLGTCESYGYPFALAPGRNLLLPTLLGTLRPTCYAPTTMASGDLVNTTLQTAGTVLVVGFEGLLDFHPGLVVEGLRRRLPEVRLESTSVALPLPAENDNTPAMYLATCLDRPEYRKLFASRLEASLRGRFGTGRTNPDVVLLPAVLGLDDPVAAARDLEHRLGARVAEVPLLPPSIPGVRLATLWRRHLLRAGVDLVLDARVIGAGSARGRITHVDAQGAGGTARYGGKAFVLATGGLAGNGLCLEGSRLREPVFDLRMAPDVRPGTGSGPGILAGPDLRPPGYDNLFACGRILSGYDPYAEKCGNGVAIATGWRAGELAAGEAEGGAGGGASD